MHQRSIYNALDWLGDIGGLLDALTVIGSFLMTIYTFIIGDPLDSYILYNLFKTEQENTSQNFQSPKQRIHSID